MQQSRDSASTSEARPRSTLGGDFHRFWLAASVSNLGDGIRLGALPLLALRLTDDARLIGAVTALTLAPWLLLAPLAGAMVDRGNRRQIMLVAQIGRAVLAIGLASLVLADAVSIAMLFVVGFGLGAGEVFVDSAAQAAVPQLVDPDQLDRANGRMIASVTLLNEVVGIALGAALFTLATSAPFLVDAATFVVGAALLTTVRRPLQGARTNTTGLGADIAEGFRFLRRHALLRRLAGSLALANVATNMSFGVLVILVVDELGASEVAFGLILAGGAVGGVLGSLLASLIVARLGRRATLAIGPFAVIGCLVANAAAQHPAIISATLFVTMFVVVASTVPMQSLRQSVTPEPLLGRVIASFRTFGLGAAPVGALMGGFIANATDVRVANLVAAGVCAGAALFMLRALTELDASPNAKNPALP